MGDIILIDLHWISKIFEIASIFEVGKIKLWWFSLIVDQNFFEVLSDLFTFQRQ